MYFRARCFQAQCEPTVSCDYEIIFHYSHRSYLAKCSKCLSFIFVFEMPLQNKHAFHVHVAVQASSGNVVVILLFFVTS